MSDGASYDEDLSSNVFYKTLQEKFTTAYENAVKKNWLICVPKVGSFDNAELTEDVFLSHILVSVNSNEGRYKTLKNQSVQLVGKRLCTRQGFDFTKELAVLFEEVFIHDDSEQHRVLCVSEPLSGPSVSKQATSDTMIFTLTSIEDCTDLLFRKRDNRGRSSRLRSYIETALSNFVQTVTCSDYESLDQCVRATQLLYTKCLDATLKDPNIRSQIRTNGVFLDYTKLALETYIMSSVYARLFPVLCDLCSTSDELLNRNVRRAYLVASANLLSIPQQFVDCLPRARRQLSNLHQFTTPLGKCSCLRSAITELSHTGSLLTADSLLPVLVLLVIKLEHPQWFAELAFMRRFRFAKPLNNDEFEYFLSSLDAALNYLVSPSGQLDLCSGNHPPLRSRLQTATATGNSPMLFEAIHLGEISRCRDLLSRIPPPSSHSDTVESIESQLCHPLCRCAVCEQLLAKQHAATQGADAVHSSVTSRDERNWTPLHAASYYGHIELVQLLLTFGSDPHSVDFSGATSLHLAALNGHLECCLALLDAGCELWQTDADGWSSLHYAVDRGHLDTVKGFVFNQSADIDIRCVITGDTPLHLAAKWRYRQLVTLLLASGANPTLVNKRGFNAAEVSSTPHIAELIRTAQHSFTKVTTTTTTHQYVSLMEDRQVSPCELDVVVKSMESNGRIDKLLRAAADGDLPMVRHYLGLSNSNFDDEILEMGHPMEQLCHPLCQCDKCAPLQPSSTTDLTVNSSNNDGFTLMHVAAIHGHTQLAQFALSKRADTNYQTVAGRFTPLHFACQHSRPQMVQLLLSMGSQQLLPDKSGNLPLHLCAMKGHVDCADKLLQSVDGRSALNVVNNRGNTPLHEAARGCYSSICELFLKHGANPTYRNRQQLIPAQLTADPSTYRILTDCSGGATCIPWNFSGSSEGETSGIGASPCSSLLDLTLTPSSSFPTVVSPEVSSSEPSPLRSAVLDKVREIDHTSYQLTYNSESSETD